MLLLATGSFALEAIAQSGDSSKPLNVAIADDLADRERSKLIRVRGIVEASSRRLVMYPEKEMGLGQKTVVWVDGLGPPHRQIKEDQAEHVARGELVTVLYRLEAEGYLERAKKFRTSNGPPYTGNGFGIDGYYGLRFVVVRWIRCERLGLK